MCGKKLLNNLMDLDKPVLTKALAPKLAPFAKLIYIISLAIIALGALFSLGLLFCNISLFIASLFMIVVEFCLVRMFCEYLASAERKSEK